MHISEQHWIILRAVIFLLVLFNLFVSIRLLIYDGYSAPQKLTQLLIIWLLPFFGPILVLSIMSGPLRVKKDNGFTQDNGENPPGIRNTGDHYF
jgi:hypothetical protein